MLSNDYLQRTIDAAKDQPESIVDQMTRFLSELSDPFGENEEKRIDELIELGKSDESYQKADKIVANILVNYLPEHLKSAGIPADVEELSNLDISFSERFIVSLARYIERRLFSSAR